MRRAQNPNTHTLKQPRLSQFISPVCSSFVLVIASNMHLEPESGNRAKNVDLHTAKNIQIQLTCLKFTEPAIHRRTQWNVTSYLLCLWFVQLFLDKLDYKASVVLARGARERPDC